jgi:hypothetical protein
MREGDHGASLAVSSPPYADGCRQQGTDRHPERLEGTAFAPARYDLAVSSPPWGAGAEGGLRAEKFKDPVAFARAMSAQDGQGTRNATTPESRLAQMERGAGMGYGSEPGNLGNLPATDGDHRAALAVSSPPFGETQSGGGLSLPEARYLDGTRIGCNCGFQNQGTTPGNLASMTVSSPPYVSSLAQQSHGQSWREELTEAPGSWRDLGAGYGASPGQLGTLPEGDPGAALTVSSPPYEGSLDHAPGNKNWQPEPTETQARQGNAGYCGNVLKQDAYGTSAANIGNDQGDTFWTAARAILEQVYQALRPGGHAIWVVKAFVRDGAVVDFPGQWRALCEAVGFVTLHEHRAMLVEDHGSQMDLEGNHVKRQVARKSFFRWIYEQKYPQNRIDFEVVYCMEKPG